MNRRKSEPIVDHVQGEDIALDYEPPSALLQAPLEEADTRARIVPFPHVVAGMHIGRMQPRIVEGEFEAVLEVGAEQGYAPDGVRHLHAHLAYGVHDDDVLQQAVGWTLAQVSEDRRILVRSEGGKQRPALVIALVILRLGGSTFDARTCLHKVDTGLLSDFRYRRIVERVDAELNPRSWGRS